MTINQNFEGLLNATMEKVPNSDEDTVKAPIGDRNQTEKGEEHDCAKDGHKENSEEDPSESSEEDFLNRKKRCSECDKEDSTHIRI